MYLNRARIQAKLIRKHINKLLGLSLKGGVLSPHLFTSAQWMLPTEEQGKNIKTTYGLKAR
jgi:hypothetical protein